MANPKGEKSFTGSQVASLLEEIKSDFRAVTESVTDFSERMEKVERSLETMVTKLQAVEDSVKVAIPNHEKRIGRLETKVGV